MDTFWSIPDPSGFGTFHGPLAFSSGNGMMRYCDGGSGRLVETLSITKHHQCYTLSIVHASGHHIQPGCMLGNRSCVIFRYSLEFRTESSMLFCSSMPPGQFDQETYKRRTPDLSPMLPLFTNQALYHHTNPTIEDIGTRRIGTRRQSYRSSTEAKVGER